MNNATTLFFIISISIIFVDSVWDLGFVRAQTSDVKDVPNNPHNIIVKYCYNLLIALQGEQIFYKTLLLPEWYLTPIMVRHVKTKSTANKSNNVETMYY